MVNADIVAVLGGGHCAHAVAADLALGGFRVRLCELPAFGENLRPAAERGGIELRGVGRTGFARPEVITTDFRAAMAGARWILCTIPAYGHQAMAEAIAPWLEDGQVVVANPGCALGALAFSQLFRRLGVTARVTCAETSVVTCTARLTGPGEVTLTGHAPKVFLAAFPGNHTEALLPEFRRFYPNAAATGSILQAMLENGNIQAHPAGMVLNAGWIEHARGEFWFYKEGITPSVGRVMDAQEAERLALCMALGYETVPAHVRIGRADRMDPMPANAYEAFSGSPRLRASKGPEDLESRYLTEDIPYGLVAWSSVGEALGVPMPVSRGLIALASALRQEDYLSTGRTLANLGAGTVRGGDTLRRFFETGEL